MESHSPLSGLIAENVNIRKKNSIEQFDAMWSSSLTDSSLKGKPDNQVLDFSSRFSGLGDLLDVTSKPLIFDADNGGRIEHLSYSIRTLYLGINFMTYFKFKATKKIFDFQRFFALSLYNFRNNFSIFTPYMKFII